MVRLLKVWCAFRADDHRGLLPSKVHVGERGLSAVLSRTKTSGPDKRVQTLQIWISPEAYLCEPFWLRLGWALWEAQGLQRDYFVTLLGANFAGTMPSEPSYADLMVLPRLALTAALGFHSPTFLSERKVACAWSGHSERATLPSWVNAVGGFSDEDIDQLGRWRTRTSRRYIRNTQGLIHRMQSSVAQAYQKRPRC